MSFYKVCRTWEESVLRCLPYPSSSGIYTFHFSCTALSVTLVPTEKQSKHTNRIFKLFSIHHKSLVPACFFWNFASFLLSNTHDINYFHRMMYILEEAPGDKLFSFPFVSKSFASSSNILSTTRIKELKLTYVIWGLLKVKGGIYTFKIKT